MPRPAGRLPRPLAADGAPAPDRLDVIVSLVPTGPSDRVIVDVGCDHGHTVAAVPGAFGTERLPHRLPRRDDIPMVVADGLKPFRHVDVAIVTGMGPRLVRDVLRSGARPALAVVHSPQGPGDLRELLAADGWRIEAEALGWEGRRFAEVMRVVPGHEAHSGLELRFGPLLCHDPWVGWHARHLFSVWRDLAHQAPEGSPAHGRATAWVAWLQASGLLER